MEAVYEKKLKKVLLGHLSAENNTEELALETVKKHLSSTSLSLSVAKRGDISEIIEW